jgi:hypothetical protein
MLRVQVLDLALAVEHEVARVLRRAQIRDVRIVRALVVPERLRDGVVLDAGEVRIPSGCTYGAM